MRASKIDFFKWMWNWLLRYGWPSKNMGKPPKSSILIGSSIINHPFWGTSVFGNTHISDISVKRGGWMDLTKWHELRILNDAMLEGMITIITSVYKIERHVSAMKSLSDSQCLGGLHGEPPRNFTVKAWTPLTCPRNPWYSSRCSWNSVWTKT